MKNFMKKIAVWLLTILIVVGVLAVEWLIICGILKLITLCFGLTFSWLWATGIWLIILILRTIFKNK